MEQIVLKQLLVEGTTTGIIESCLDEWAIGGFCYKIPRIKLKEARKLAHINQMGVYILFGKDENTGNNLAYIGKSTNIYTRVFEQNYEKEFWSECLVFLSETNKIGENHIGYIESVLYKDASRVGRYEVENDKEPKKKISITTDRIEADKFIKKIKIVVSMMGYRVFDDMVHSNYYKRELILKNNGIEYARGIMTEEGFVVLKKSKIKGEISKSLSSSLIKFVVRERNSEDIGNGEFIRSRLYTSPSMAAVAILGRNSNGYNEWRNEDNKTLKQVMDEE